VGRERWEGKYLQYLSVEEFPKKRAPVTAFDRENGKGSGQGKAGKGTFIIGNIYEICTKKRLKICTRT
jgi:hypothetical protein